MMKFLGITVSLLAASGSQAFAPSNSKVSRTQLNAETLEGWKVNGNIKPVNNFILIKKAEVQKESESGIVFSKSANVVKTEGKVISVGPGKLHPDSGIPFPMPVEEGDGVVYGKYDGTEVTIDGETHSLIRDSDILVKFTGGSLTVDSVEAVNDGILVYVETREQEETSGGLLLASTGDDSRRPTTGVVTKVGPGRMAESGDLIPMSVEVGDQVKFMDFAGNEVKIGDKEYSVVQMPEIYAKF
jgi:chaperonin GroES